VRCCLPACPRSVRWANNTYWSPGQQKSCHVDFSHRGHAAAMTSAQRKLQCSASFRRPRLLSIGSRLGAVSVPKRIPPRSLP
jgi:hypothetical protein